MSTTEESFRVQDATVGVITALPKEYAAVKAALGCGAETHAPGTGAGRRYAVAAIPASGGGRHVVAVALLTEMGNNFAAIRATLMAQHCSLRHIIMTGIAGAVPNPANTDDHVRLGDLVVSDRSGVVQYDFDKESIRRKEGGHFLGRVWTRIKESIGLTAKVRLTPSTFYEDIIEHRHPLRPPSAELIEAARSLEARRLQNEYPWETHIDRVTRQLADRQWQRPPDGRDRLRDWNDGEPETMHPADRERRPGQPKLFYGTIASANKLLKNPILRDALREKFKAKAVEMEGSGVADATWNHGIGYFIVRGTCDYCNPDKGNDWQGYAAVIAACYTRCLIEATDANPAQAPPTAPLTTMPVSTTEPVSRFPGAVAFEGNTAFELARAQRIREERDQEVLRYVIQQNSALSSRLDHVHNTSRSPSSAVPGEDLRLAVKPDPIPQTDILPSSEAMADLKSQFLERASAGSSQGPTEAKQAREFLSQLKKLLDELDIDQAIGVVDKVIWPWLKTRGNSLDSNLTRQLYHQLAEVKLKQGRRATSDMEKRACLAEAELFIERATNVI